MDRIKTSYFDETLDNQKISGVNFDFAIVDEFSDEELENG